MGSAREETVQGPSSSSRKDLPKRSDPSEVGWGRKGWEAEGAGGGGKSPMEERVGVVGYSMGVPGRLGLTYKHEVTPVMVQTWAQVMGQ